MIFEEITQGQQQKKNKKHESSIQSLAYDSANKMSFRCLIPRVKSFQIVARVDLATSCSQQFEK
jgi:hypothetical protein